jgi:hypothetical protein
MQTKNSTTRDTEQPERFDEFTGGYDMTDHNRAAARINADLRKMPTPRVGHTPGPWHYSEPVRSHQQPFVYDQNGNLVANFSGWVGRTYEENVANAKLGAAAPDLYAALLAIAEGIERDLRLSVDPNHPISRDTLSNRAAAARAAIARATT